MKLEFKSAVGAPAVISVLFASNAFMCYQSTSAKVAAIFAASEVSSLLITEAIVGAILTFAFVVTAVVMAGNAYMIATRLLSEKPKPFFWRWSSTRCQIS